MLLCPVLVLARDKPDYGSIVVDEVVELRNMRRGKYFRIIADVYVDGQSLQELHLTAGTARPYAGGKREGWCD